MTFVLNAMAVLLAAAFLRMAIQRSLAERPLARKYRATFIAIANDLIAKPEFPEQHAKQLLTLSAFRSGWLTRIMVLMVFANVFRRKSTRSNVPRLADVPDELRERYVVALLSAALADSYYSLFLGAVWREMNSWVVQALQGIKHDVNAHATQTVINQVWDVPNNVPHRKSLVDEYCVA